MIITVDQSYPLNVLLMGIKIKWTSFEKENASRSSIFSYKKPWIDLNMEGLRHERLSSGIHSATAGITLIF